MLLMNMWHRFEKQSAANPTASWLQMQAACATMAWLDAWAKLLLQHQSILEQQLAKFAPVVPGEGLVWHTPQRSDWSRPGTPLNPTGGRVSGQYCRSQRWCTWGLSIAAESRLPESVPTSASQPAGSRISFGANQSQCYSFRLGAPPPLLYKPCPRATGDACHMLLNTLAKFSQF
jgi:hypothetical protein